MKTTRLHWALVAMIGVCGGPALAQISPWSVHVGAVAVGLNVKTTAESPQGTPIPGSSLSAGDGTTLGVEVGYDVTPSWTGRLTVGVPLKSTVTGTGTLSPLGAAGALKYGPAILTATYRLGKFGSFQPYVGAGAAYLIVFSTEDAGVSNFKVKNAFGSALQIGADLDLGGGVGLFIDVKKVYVKTTVTGTVPAFGGAPAFASARVDPLLIHAGLSYRF
ncbi:OmpW/AlkL family protein [Polaromonas hydrogenivorans]|uniref:OmpW family outer membrane protein n=1 Tax=Polaromonas hydrogenivorans TaxID=335476 RepID=A0AAU7LZ06_9BURK